MNSKIKVAKFEPGPTLERTIIEVKDNHQKRFNSSTMNLSAITLFDKNSKQISINIRIKVAKFEPVPTFEKTITEIKDNNLKSIASAAMSLLAITCLMRILKILV